MIVVCVLLWGQGRKRRNTEREALPDADLKMRWGVGGGLQKSFFLPFGPQFGPKIKGALRHWEVCRNFTIFWYLQKSEKYLKKLIWNSSQNNRVFFRHGFFLFYAETLFVFHKGKMSWIKKVLNSYLSKIVFFFRGYRYHSRIVQAVAPSKSVLPLGGQLKYQGRLYGEEQVGDPHNTNVRKISRL